MEKKEIQFILEKIEEVSGHRVRDEESGEYYEKKYLVISKPFIFQGQEYSKIEFFTNGYIEFEGISLTSSEAAEFEKLKNFVWKIWWWENPNNPEDNSYPKTKINEAEKKIKLVKAENWRFEKVHFKDNLLTISPLENGIKKNIEKGRLEVKIKPIKINQVIEINQISIACLKFLDDNGYQKILTNFTPQKLITICFSQKIGNSISGPTIEIKDNQNNLDISLLHLKNEFSDDSWFSTADNYDYSPNKTPSPFGQKKIIFLVVLIALLLIVVFIFVKNLTKKKKKIFLGKYYGRSFSFRKY